MSSSSSPTSARSRPRWPGRSTSPATSPGGCTSRTPASSRIDIGPTGPTVRWFNRGLRTSVLSAPKKASAASSHVGSDAPRRRAAAASCARHASSTASRSSTAREAVDVAGVTRQPSCAVGDEVGQVARPPADGGQARRRAPRRTRSRRSRRSSAARTRRRRRTGRRPRRGRAGRARRPGRAGRAAASRGAHLSPCTRHRRRRARRGAAWRGRRAARPPRRAARARPCSATSWRRRAGPTRRPRRRSIGVGSAGGRSQPGSTTRTRSGRDAVLARRARSPSAAAGRHEQVAAAVERRDRAAAAARCAPPAGRCRRAAGGGSRRPDGPAGSQHPRGDRPRRDAVDDDDAREPGRTGSATGTATTNSTVASLAGAASAIRRWYRCPPVSWRGEPRVTRVTTSGAPRRGSRVSRAGRGSHRTPSPTPTPAP